MLRGRFIAIQACLKKQERNQINNLTLHLKQLEKEEIKNPHFHFSLSCIGEGNGNPVQCSCLENLRDGEAWWAAVYGVAQSRTRLKRLSSSSSIRVSRRKEILKIRAEKNAKETKETIAKINKTKSWFFERINKIDKPLARLIKKQREKNQINTIRNENG